MPTFKVAIGPIRLPKQVNGEKSFVELADGETVDLSDDEVKANQDLIKQGVLVAGSSPSPEPPPPEKPPTTTTTAKKS